MYVTSGDRFVKVFSLKLRLEINLYLSTIVKRLGYYSKNNFKEPPGEFLNYH